MKKILFLIIFLSFGLSAQSFDEMKRGFEENWKCAAVGVAAGVVGTKAYDMYLGDTKKLNECSKISSEKARLNCYDKVVKERK